MDYGVGLFLSHIDGGDLIDANKIIHDIHGDDFHDLCIYLAQRLCKKRRYIDLNPKWLKDKAMYPGIPDVYVRVPYRNVSERGRATHDYTDYIIEIETKASAESVLKKEQQFSRPEKHELIIIDFSRFKGNKANWIELELFIEGRLPT